MRTTEIANGQPSPPLDRIQALSRGLRILEFVHEAGRPVGIKEIASGVELHLATTYHLVNTLLYEGYLVRDSARLLVPGKSPGRTDRQDDTKVQLALGRAAYAVEDVAVLARLVGAETRVIASAEVPGAPCAGHYARGAAALSHIVAVGRVILAFQPPDVAEAAIELTRRVASQRNELFNEAELRHALDAIVERRFSAVVGEGDACVGVPIFNRDGTAGDAVAVVVRPRQLSRAADDLIHAASVAGREISAAMDALQSLEPAKGESCTHATGRSISSSTATSTSGTPARTIG